MSKYRRITSNMDIKDKKKQKNNNQNNKQPDYVDTKSLMEKLGIKITNKDIYTKKFSLHLKQKKSKDENINIATTTLNNEDKYNVKDFKSKSLQKRKNDNDNRIKNKNNMSSSYEKRLIKKDKKVKTIEEKNSTRKEKEKSIKTKKSMKENNDKNENNGNYQRKKTMKKEVDRQPSKKDNRSIGNNSKDSKKYKKVNQTQEAKISLFKKNRDQKDIKRTTTNKMQNNINTNKVTNDFNRTFYKKLTSNINYNDDYKINEVYESPAKTKTKKYNENKNKKDIKKIDIDKNDIDKKDEKIKKFRKNKAISVDKIKNDNKIFNFKSQKIKEKNKKKNNSYDSQDNSDSENSNTSESESEESSSSNTSSSSSETEKSNPTPDEKAIIRSNKRHLTEMASQKTEKKEKSNEENEKDEKKEKNEKIDEEKRIIISNKRHLTEMASQNNETNEKGEEEKQNEKEEEEEKQIIRSNKRHLTEFESQSDKNKIEEKDIVRANKKRLTEMGTTKNNEMDKKLLGGRYIKRNSIDNPLLRERLDLLVNEMVLKQNGGNASFLKNFEKGKYYQKEIEICVKNQNIKKKIKICSCTKPGCSGPGVVKTNQDAYFVKDNFLKNNNNFFLGVCDGHGERGELVSRYVVNKLPEYIKDLNNENITNIFKKINNEVYNNKSIESNMSGTTVVSLFITTEKIICANLGDSRAAIFKYENGLYYYKNLSRDHKPGDPEENKRIINNNGRVKKCYDEDLKKYLGPDRVWLKNKEEPGLAMSRSIGDKVAHSVGVIDEPEFKNFEYDGNEKFIIIASDGIWEYLHGDDCIKIIKPIYEDSKDCEEAALALVKEAFRKWKRKEVAIDDITAIVVFFED